MATTAHYQLPVSSVDRRLWGFLSMLHGVESESERTRLIASALPSFIDADICGVALMCSGTGRWQGTSLRQGSAIDEAASRKAIDELEPALEAAFNDPPLSYVDITDAASCPTLSEAGVGCVIIAPLATVLGPLGAAFVGVRAGRRLSRSMTEILMIIAEQAAIAFENLRLQSRLQLTAEHLEVTAAKYRNLYDHTPVMMHEIDQHGTLRRVNNRWIEVLGYEPIEVIGQSAARYMTRDSRKYALETVIPQIFSEGSVTDVEYEFVKKNGEIAELQLSAVSHRDPQTGEQRALAFLLDITAKKRAERRAAERTKDLEAFSYSVSHDLRSPLRAIDGFSRIILEEHMGSLGNEPRRLLGVIRRNAQTMAQLIDGLLSFSRLGRQGMTFTDVDLAELVNGVIEDLRIEISDRNVEFQVDKLPTIRGDRTMLRQVVINLLSNALKFSFGRNPAIVNIGSDVGGRTATIGVHDNGVGFDPEYAGKLFGVFQRLHSAEEFDGTGVGLALVKRIIARHGGAVWAESAVNKGASFFFSLPISGARE